MKTAWLMLDIIALLTAQLAGAQAQQPSTKNDMPGMQMQSPDETRQPAPANLLPEIGAQPQNAGPLYELAGLEARALQHNPTIAQADASGRIAEARKQQAGLWPNPTIGYLGDEIAGGVGVNGGRQGGFVEQTIVLGRKLYLAQQVAGSDVKIAALEKDEQRYRVQTAVRAAYFQTLAAQELATLANQYVKLATESLDTARRLRNTGARDESEVAMAEIELERARLAADVEQVHLRQEWEGLRSVVGDLSLPPGWLNGKLDAGLPQIDSQHLVDALIADSPAIKIAGASITRGQNSVLEARRQSVPDIRVRAGLEQNFEQNELTGKPYGLEGLAEVRVELPIFNRNQGNVAAGRAELESSRAEGRRIELELRRQAAAVVEQYEAARTTVEHYQNEILPRTRRLYDMQRDAWGRMALSYPQVLLAQQSLFMTEAEYIRALQQLRTNAVALSGFLLTDGLAAPSAR